MAVTFDSLCRECRAVHATGDYGPRYDWAWRRMYGPTRLPLSLEQRVQLIRLLWMVD